MHLGASEGHCRESIGSVAICPAIETGKKSFLLVTYHGPSP